MKAIALVSSVLSLLFVSASIGAAPIPSKEDNGNQYETRDRPKERQQPILPPAVKTVVSIKSSKYEQPCEPKKDNRDSDLCAQWKAADAASETARLTLYSLIASFFGLIGLLFTYIQTKRTADVTAKALYSVERPKLIMTTGSCTIDSDTIGTKQLWIAFSIHNVGRQPAVIDDLKCGLFFSQTAPPLSDAIRQMEEVHTILNIGDELQRGTWNPAPIHGDIGWFYGIVRYTDFFNVRYESEWCWQLDSTGWPTDKTTSDKRNRHT